MIAIACITREHDGLEYEIDFSPGYPPPSTSDPDNPGYGDPGDPGHFSVLKATITDCHHDSGKEWLKAGTLFSVDELTEEELKDLENGAYDD